jgi:hypothetical protein
MPQWRPLVGRLLFVFAVFVAGYLGATMGDLGTREVRASHNFGDVPDSAFSPVAVAPGGSAARTPSRAGRWRCSSRSCPTWWTRR